VPIVEVLISVCFFNLLLQLACAGEILPVLVAMHWQPQGIKTKLFFSDKMHVMHRHSKFVNSGVLSSVCNF